MNHRILRNLAWKEWHEHGWKMAFGCALLASLCFIGLRSRIVEDRAVLLLTAFLGGLLLPVFVAMGLVAEDRSRGSLKVLLSMPVRPTAVLAIKVVVGVLITVVPLAAAAGVVLMVAGEREMASEMTLRAFLETSVLAVLTMVWTVCFGVRQGSEARVGLVGLAVLTVWGIAMVLMSEADHTLVTLHPFILLTWAFTDRMSPGDVLLTCCVHVVVIVALLAWAAWRLGCPRSGPPPLCRCGRPGGRASPRCPYWPAP